MAATSYETASVSDSHILKALREICGTAPISNVQVLLEVLPGINSGELDFGAFEKLSVVEKARADLTAANWRSVSLRFRLPSGRGSIGVSRNDSTTKIDVNVPDPTALEDVDSILRAIKAQFPFLDRFDSTVRALGPELSEFYRKREEALGRLEALSQQLIEKNEAYRKTMDAEMEAGRAKLLDAMREQEQQLKGRYDSEYQELEQQRAALASREKELDDRSAKFVRRDAVRGLKQILADRGKSFRLTADTSKKRWPVHAIFLSLLSLALVVVGYALFGANQLAEPQWLVLLRLPIGLSTFALTALFYIRWNDHWARQHADEEFRLRQLELDIDRASWVTELALELKDEQGELPAALLDRLSAGLFSGYASEPVKHPAQDVLGALLGQSSRLRLKLPVGVEADLNRNALRRADKALSQSK